MAIFKTKDYGAGKSDKARLAVGRKLGTPGVQATNNQVDEQLEQYLRELVEIDEAATYAASKPAPDPM